MISSTSARTILLAGGLALLLSLPVPGTAQRWSPEEREIRTLQDQRSLGGGVLQGFLTNQSATIRFRAAMALANIQARDSAAVAGLLNALVDPAVRVRAAAAFALGQSGIGQVQPALLDRINVEPDETVLGKIIEALGKIGSPAALDTIARYAERPLSPELRRDILLGVSRFALRGVKTKLSIELALQNLRAQEASARWLALYALWRSAPDDILNLSFGQHEKTFERLVRDESPEVRMHAATVFGRVPHRRAKDLLLILSSNEIRKGDWRVKVQIVRSLGALLPQDPGLIKELGAYIFDPNPHVVITALSVLQGDAGKAMGEAGNEAIADAVTGMASPAGNVIDPVRGEALVAAGRHMPARLRTQALADSQSASSLIQMKMIEAIAQMPDAAGCEFILRKTLSDSIRVAMASWDFVRLLFAQQNAARLAEAMPGWNQVPARLASASERALRRDDMAVTTLVANAFRDSNVVAAIQKSGVGPVVTGALARAYTRLKHPDDVEAKQAVLGALGILGDSTTVPVLEAALSDSDQTVSLQAALSLYRLTRRDYSARVRTASAVSHTDYDWDTLESLSPRRRAVLETTRGRIVIQLLRDDAPFTVLNFVRLMSRGFFDGKTFHRVVPNFVVQGGDPRGDGWGGPGYSIRTEISFASFERGAVGVASSGKDTEGCQFFITHQAVPHLDGRYTVFGMVVEGMDIADALQIGDRILSFRLE